MECCKDSSRCTVYIINTLFALSSIFMIIFGFNSRWIHWDIGRFNISLSNQITDILFFTGFILFSISLFGIIGIKTRSICYLRIYMILISILFLGQIIIMILSFYYGNNNDNIAQNIWDHSYNNTVIDEIQDYFNCCGYLNYTDDPGTNCNIIAKRENTTIYKLPGCKETISSWLHNNMNFIGKTSIIVFILEVVLIGATYLSIYNIKKELLLNNNNVYNYMTNN